MFGYLNLGINEIFTHWVCSQLSQAEVDLDTVLGRLCEIREALSQCRCAGACCSPPVTHFAVVLSKWSKLIDGGKRFLLSSLWPERYIEKSLSRCRIAGLFIMLAQEHLFLFPNSCGLSLLCFSSFPSHAQPVLGLIWLSPLFSV